LSPVSEVGRTHLQNNAVPTLVNKQGEEKETSSILSSKPSWASLRAGATVTETYGGVAAFLALDHAFRVLFKANGIAFPSQLGGCCILFVTLLLTDIILPGVGQGVFEKLVPGAAWLAAWLPVFFVPGLAMLPLAPSMGTTLDIVKILSVVLVGFFYTLSTTGFAVLAIRKLQGQVSDAPASAPAAASTSAASKPYSEEMVSSLLKGLALSGLASTIASRKDNQFATPLRTIFMSLTTVTGYVWGARLPSSSVKVVHPLVTSAAVTLVMTHLAAFLTSSTFEGVLSTYKVGSIAPKSAGAGDILLYLLGPSVVSFAIPMFSRKQVMAENLLVVVTAMLIASVGGLFGTAAFVRLLGIGGGALIRLSLLPRNVTTPLAIAITNIIGGDISIAAAIVVLTGIFGATYGARILNAMGINDPVSRGLGMGAAAQGLGVASIANEKEAFPFAAISMVLTAVAATTVVSIPSLKDAVVKVATG